MNLNSKCPVCISGALQPTQIGKTQLMKCGTCRTVVTPPSVQSDDLADYYKRSYTLTSTVVISSEFHRYFRYPEYLQLLNRVQSVLPPPANWLDVGCDHGFFLDEVRRAGYNASGVEPSDSARGYAQRIGLNVVDNIEKISELQDVISMWHVLEHIPQPAEYVAMLHGRLNTGGLLCIRVPDFESTWSKILKDKWVWFQPKQHAIHFNIDSLVSMLQSAGYTIEISSRQRPNNSTTFRSFNLATSVFRKLYGSKYGSFMQRAKRFAQDVIGQELFVIARKK